jgi:hypothetical protein
MLDGGKLKPVMLERGVQNTRYAEVMTDRLKAGDEVVVGLIGTTAQNQGQAQNPFMPRMPGGGGGGGRRGN